MTGLKAFVAAGLITMIPATAALAQLSEPAAFEAQYPNRDVLNGGALTPAGRAALAASGGAAGAYRVDDAHAGIGTAAPVVPVKRYRGRKRS